MLGLWFGIFAPFAIVVAIGSRRCIRASRGARTGAEFAAGGLVAGVIGLAMAVVGVVYWLLT